MGTRSGVLKLLVEVFVKSVFFEFASSECFRSKYIYDFQCNWFKNKAENVSETALFFMKRTTVS